MKRIINENKKILIIVPHEDDEMNLVGGMLNSTIFNKKNCKVVYTTNGNYCWDAEVRIREAKKALTKLGIKKEQIIFLGYDDQSSEESTHIYQTFSPNVWKSKNDKVQTSGIKNVDEFCFIKNHEHHSFNFENLLLDMINVIKQELPDVIFTVDFDSHPDHRAASLIFERALGIVLKDILNYHPSIYKGFAYPTSYKGIDDYNEINLQSTKFKVEENSLSKYQNPYYLWDERVRFPVGKEVFNYLYFLNPLYRSLRNHQSQLIIKKAPSIINSDQVFWQKRSDNLLFSSKVSVSSGEKCFLNDFLLFDCLDIMHGNDKKPVLKENCWIPQKNDSKKEILVELNEKKNIDRICFYQNSMIDERISKVLVSFSNGEKLDFKLGREKKSIMNFSVKEDISWIKIKVLEQENEFCGFSELEIFEPIKEKNSYLKLIINNSFSDKVYLKDETNLQIYYYDGLDVIYLHYEECNFKLNGNKISYNDLKKEFYGILEVSLKNDASIYDKVLIKKLNFFAKLNFELKKIINNCYLNFDIFYLRVKNKILKIFRSFL